MLYSKPWITGDLPCYIQLWFDESTTIFRANGGQRFACLTCWFCLLLSVVLILILVLIVLFVQSVLKILKIFWVFHSVPMVVLVITLVTLIPVAVLLESCHIGSLTWAWWLKHVETTAAEQVHLPAMRPKGFFKTLNPGWYFDLFLVSTFRVGASYFLCFQQHQHHFASRRRWDAREQKQLKGRTDWETDLTRCKCTAECPKLPQALNDTLQLKGIQLKLVWTKNWGKHQWSKSNISYTGIQLRTMD